MISITHEADNKVIANVLGEFKLADFQELEKAVEYTIQFQGRANLLVNLQDMLSFSIDVAWEEIKFTRQHARDFDRIALVAGSEWQEWAAWLTRLFTEADFQVFEDYHEAHQWIQEGGL